MANEPAKASVAVTGTTTATVVAFPANYWEDTTLNLHFTSAADLSIDDAGAKKIKKKSNTPLTYVKAMQADLILLGYLATGKDDGVYTGPVKRAVLRFQRHARRVYRLIDATKAADDVAAAAVFTGANNGVCDHDTAQQIQTWKTKGWVIPIGRFPVTALANGGGRLRQDAASVWDALVASVAASGGTLESPYGDSLRVLAKFSKSGASNFSFHYCGRAVDINQGLAGRRYFISKDASGTSMFWRIFCKTDKQDGTQGVKQAKGSIKCFDFTSQKEFDIKEGHYLDLTAAIEATGKFERIKAHDDWPTNYNATEWWHFQYNVDKQETFQDELELTGRKEAEIRAAGWDSDAELDHKPG